MNGAGIIALVAESFGLSARNLTGANRSKRYTRPRYIAMALIRDYLSYSSPQIRRLFGDRDHTTVLAALKRAEHLVETDQVLAAKVEQLRIALDLCDFDKVLDTGQAKAMAGLVVSAFRTNVIAAAKANPEAFLRGASDLLRACKMEDPPCGI